MRRNIFDHIGSRPRISALTRSYIFIFFACTVYLYLNLFTSSRLSSLLGGDQRGLWMRAEHLLETYALEVGTVEVTGLEIDSFKRYVRNSRRAATGPHRTRLIGAFIAKHGWVAESASSQKFFFSGVSSFVHGLRYLE